MMGRLEQAASTPPAATSAAHASIEFVFMAFSVNLSFRKICSETNRPQRAWA
jgi:hypothetical protein